MDDKVDDDSIYEDDKVEESDDVFVDEDDHKPEGPIAEDDSSKESEDDSDDDADVDVSKADSRGESHSSDEESDDKNDDDNIGDDDNGFKDKIDELAREFEEDIVPEGEELLDNVQELQRSMRD